MATPEGFAEAFIEFINNGARFEDLQLLLISKNEGIELQRMMNFSQEEIDMSLNAELYEKTLKKLEKFWVQQNFNKRLSLRPYKFQSFSYTKKTDMVLIGFRINATDKNGLIHTFQLEGILKIKENWKSIYSDLNDFRDVWLVQ